MLHRGVDAGRRGSRWWSSSSAHTARQHSTAGSPRRSPIAYALRPHSFIVGGFSLVIAVQLISLGLLATQTKRYFEELFHLGTMLNRRAIQLERQSKTLVAPEAEVEPGSDQEVASRIVED